MSDGSPADAVRAAWERGGVEWAPGAAEQALIVAEQAGLMDNVTLKADGSVPDSEVRRIAWKTSLSSPWLVKAEERPALAGPQGASGGRIGVDPKPWPTGHSKKHLRKKYNY